MFKTLRRILGIGSADLIGGQSTLDVTARRLTAMAGRGQFAPASRLDAATIEGVQPDGSVWEFWRTDRATGEKWYRRVSETIAPDVHAFAPVDDAGDDAVDDDDDDELDPLSHSDEFEPVYETDPETGERVYNAGLILRNAKARNRARERANRLLFRCDEPAANSDDDGDGQGSYQ